ncbi:unnamed protein product [Cuscuta epithymum]|uniref:SET domain-containing protein n=3 Tax=Cuscuta epithymum TaxID=186058 RepID=A0AAV0FYK5_9ASTE|nr:unnamed protein product [Cuscuta epithymum]
MAAARRMRDGLNLESSLAEDCAVEEAVLCLVLTNAVEVQDRTGCSVGVAVYGPRFSWINHSCSPNSSYWFSTVPSSGAASSGLIHPKPTDGDNRNGSELINTKISFKFLSSLGIEEGYGPSLIIRSIKNIKQGEELLITYTDLLQPKGMRRFDLWLKYRFLCCCYRCNADPKTYVDHILEEVSFTSHGCPTSTITSNFCGDFSFTNKKLVARFDEAIDEFLASDNSISCCSELENLLTHGYPTEMTCETLKLHPLHHLSLKAYTTLASAYKALASDLLAFNPMSEKDNLKAFSFSKASAAYSLLLACSTHHLFLFEPSLIVSYANFWTSAGQSLLSLVEGFSSFSSQSCKKCTLQKHNFNVELPEISRQFLNCVSDLIPKVWHFLSEEGRFLVLVKDPIDLRWIGSMGFSILATDNASSELKTNAETESVDSTCMKTCLFQVGFHCVIYGSLLSSLCSGQQITP